MYLHFSVIVLVSAQGNLSENELKKKKSMEILFEKWRKMTKTLIRLPTKKESVF